MRFLLLIALTLAPPVAAQTDSALQARIEARLADAATGTRFGLVVADAEGREIVSIAPEARFIPASNTKMFTTAAAYWAMANLDAPDATGGATVALDGRDVVLKGYGDARLSSRADCTENCLAALADAVAAKTRRVRDVTGDASAWPDQRWSPGMSWNNVAERSGTGIAALSLDSNEIALTVTPAAAAGTPPTVAIASDYLAVDNRAMTIASGATTIDVERLPFERTVRVTGQIAVGARDAKVALGIDDPAHYAAWRLVALLRDRKVRVLGTARSRYAPSADAGAPLLKLVPPPLAADIVTINKISQNLHADLLLRRLGAGNDGGLAAVERMLATAGVARTHYDFSDGSGMSTYNRVAPRGAVTFLRWVAAQPWGAAWRGSLPIGGVDGTIASRFKGTALEGRIFAKTGGLNATAALSGYLIARSGRELTFSLFANDMPAGSRAQPVMDAVLVMIAEAN